MHGESNSVRPNHANAFQICKFYFAKSFLFPIIQLLSIHLPST
nr:MAG TPA: hypothetical protein [Bacteriophage sp.]DAM14966.1 MAG TPA: hypothetical protein [Bacteriophage sp.]